MNTSTLAKSREFYAARVMLISMFMGLACMAALFIAGHIQGSAGMAFSTAPAVGIGAGRSGALCMGGGNESHGGCLCERALTIGSSHRQSLPHPSHP